MRVRPFEPRDSEALSNVFVRSVEELGRRDYSAAQVAAWRSRAPTPARMVERAGDGRSLLVVVDEADVPIAFGDLEADGHIDLLYCAPEASGSGAAALLYDEIERLAHARGLARLYSEASEAAKRFFLKRGFVVLHRRDFDVAGVAIHNYAMQKALPPLAERGSREP